MKFLFVGISVLSLFACKSGSKDNLLVDIDTVTVTIPAEDTTTRKNVIPISPNTWWLYNTVHYDSAGKVEVADTDTIRIQKTDTFNNKIYFYLNPFWVRNQDWNTIVAYDELTNTEFEVKNNAIVNLGLTKYVGYHPSPGCKHGIKFYGYKDRTTIKDFDCYKISYKVTACTGEPFAYFDMYLSEGVGIVRTEEYRYDKGRKWLFTTQELETYHAE